MRRRTDREVQQASSGLLLVAEQAAAVPETMVNRVLRFRIRSGAEEVV